MSRHFCSDSPSGELLQAVGEFNRRDWYECHETLEELWVGSEFEPRWLYQGMLQVAIALLHWRNGNYGGACSLLTGGTDYLKRVGPVCLRIDVASLVAESEIFREELTRLGPERMAELSTDLIPNVRLAASSDL